jgi:putative membrane protein
MRYVYIALIVLLTAVVLAFMVQNLESVTVSFFAIRITLPLALLVILVYFVGMVTGGALLSLVRSWITHARSRSG